MMRTYVNDLELNVELVGQVVGCLEILEAAKNTDITFTLAWREAVLFPLKKYQHFLLGSSFCLKLINYVV